MKNLLVFSFLLFLSLPLHEAGHWLAAKVLGVSGSISIDWFSYSGGFNNSSGILWQDSVIGFAGGFFAAIIFVLFGLIAKMPAIKILAFVWAFFMVLSGIIEVYPIF